MQNNNNFMLEMLPLIVFFAIYHFTKDLFLATGVCIAVTWLTVGYAKLRYKSVAKNQLISAVLITGFGGITILFHNEMFVMLKPTALYWIMGVSLLISDLIGKNALKLMLAGHVHLADKQWRILTWMWIVFFAAMGALNLFIAFTMSVDLWVKFKVFGGMACMLVWMIVSAIYVHRQGGIQTK